jgi:hypothetical protein
VLWKAVEERGHHTLLKKDALTGFSKTRQNRLESDGKNLKFQGLQKNGRTSGLYGSRF